MRKFGCWIIGIVATVLVFMLLVIVVCIYTSLERKTWDTYYGKINIDTLEVVFNDFNDKEPCYKIHTEIVEEDTIDYYFYPWKQIYYRSAKDKYGRKGYVMFDPRNNYTYDIIHYIDN